MLLVQNLGAFSCQMLSVLPLKTDRKIMIDRSRSDDLFVFPIAPAQLRQAAPSWGESRPKCRALSRRRRDNDSGGEVGSFQGWSWVQVSFERKPIGFHPKIAMEWKILVFHG